MTCSAKYGLILCALLSLSTPLVPQQNAPAPATPDKTAQQLVQAAVNSELQANRTDHSAWMYRDHEKTPEKDYVSVVVETPQGSVQRKVQDHGQNLTEDQRREEDQRIQSFLTDPALQAKRKKDGQHDDEQAARLLRLLPVAFTWSVKSEHGDLTTLAFEPDPRYDADSMESHVLSTMAGEMIVSRPQNRIQSLRGTLTDDVKIAYGVLGRLRKGGTFNIERREIEPHKWQIVESHVHIDGRALLFKTIGQQEDETKSDFKPSPATTLVQAAAALNDVH